MPEPGQDLSPLLAPRTVAIIGASERGHYASSIHKNLVRGGFPPGNLFPVNPKHQQIFELPCYPTVKDIPADVDLGIIVVPRCFVLPIAKECGEKGVRSLFVVSMGFAEAGEEGRRYQEQLAGVARDFGMSLLGPNTMGLVYPRTRCFLWGASLPDGLRPGGLAAIFQSSGMLNLFFAMVAQRGLGLSLGLAPGNEAGLGMTDYLSWAVEDPETQVVVLVIESIQNPRGFRKTLERAWELRKPILALRLGRSARAKRSIVSHTGSLATTGEAWDGLFEQEGVIRVNNLDDLIEGAVFFGFADLDQTKKNSLGLVTISGGDCSLLSDICDRVGLMLPDLEGESRRLIARELGKDSFVGNPLDVEDLLVSNQEGFYRSMEAFASFPGFAVIGCRLNIPARPNERLREAYHRISEIVGRAGKQLVFFSRASEQLVQEWFDLFTSLRVPFLLEYEKGLRTVRGAIRLAEKRLQRAGSGEEEERGKAPDAERLREILLNSASKVLPTKETLFLFREYGIPVARTELASSSKEAVDLAETIGYPVVVKVSSVDIPHRSDIGAVQTGLETPEKVGAAYEMVVKRCEEARPGARFEGVVIQPMVQGVGEMILGVSRDPQLGPVILLGVGGILVESLKDVVLRVPPFNLRDCQEMIDGLRGKALLMGTRGQPRGDLGALARAILALSRLALDLGEEIEEVDLNPVIVRPEGEGVVAVDGLVAVRVGNR
ncbi:MAG: acetate--CoA ligase family protein [Candidatus Binatia bacterium]